MNKLLMGLFTLGVVSNFTWAQEVIEIMPMDEGIFEDAQYIASKPISAQKEHLVRLYQKYNLDISGKYALINLNYVGDKIYSIQCGINPVQRVLNSSQSLESNEPEMLYTYNYISLRKSNAVLLQKLKSNVKLYRLMSFCRKRFSAHGGAMSWSNDVEDTRNTVDALVITGESVIERNSFYTGDWRFKSWQSGSTLNLEYSIPQANDQRDIR